MKKQYLSCNLSLPLLYADYARVEKWWNYKDVISPFYRLYLITKGEGRVYINQKAYDLCPGSLFLIPKFAFHSYACEDFMEHYYICFFDETVGGGGIVNPMKMDLLIPATQMDSALMERFLVLNPDRSLPVTDPKKYDNDRRIYEKEKTISVSDFARVVESNGILLQLFSRFVTEESLHPAGVNNSYEKLNEVIQYIDKNLDQRIAIVSLADLMCLTTDHFSKVFKRIIGMPPSEYIQVKRIERAQTLLLTSHLSIAEIAEKVGIGNLSQFSHLFSRMTHCSPKKYRTRFYDYSTPLPYVKCGSIVE